MVTVSTFNRRRRSPPAFEAPRRGGKKSSTDYKKLAVRLLSALAVLALLVTGVLWAAGFFSAPAEVRALRSAVDQQVAQYNQIANGNGSFSSSFAGGGSMFEMMRNVPEGYRDQVRGEMGRLFEARERAETNSFFMMSPDQRMAELDRRIQDEEAQREARRQEWSQRQASGDQNRGPRGDNGGRGGPPGGVGQGGGPQAGGGPPGGGRGDWGRGSFSSEERRKSRLDSSSPQDRAQRDEYRRLMQQRREQLGLSGGRRW
jgi:hypothetical protein